MRKINHLERNHLATFLIFDPGGLRKTTRYFRRFGVSEHELELDTPFLSCMLPAH